MFSGIFSSEPIGEALVRGCCKAKSRSEARTIFEELASQKGDIFIAKMRAQYEQGTL